MIYKEGYTDFFNKFKLKKFSDYVNSLPFITNKVEAQEFCDLLENNTSEIINNFKYNENILIKGDVQSGKTNNILKLIYELERKHKVDIFIYLTGRVNELKTQNHQRISDGLEKISDKFILKTDQNKNFSEKLFRYAIKESKIPIISCLKLKDTIKKLSFAINNSENKYKVVVIDDESDEASLTETTFLQIKSLIKSTKTTYISLTATPYRNLMFFENFFHKYYALKNPSNYTGLLEFSKNKVYTITKNDINDIDTIFKIFVKHILKIVLNNWSDSEMLINISTEKFKHKNIYNSLNKKIKNMLEGDYDEELLRSLSGKDNFIFNPHDILSRIKEFLKTNAHIIQIYNGENKPADHLKHKVIIGGMLLSRGITFPHLKTQIISANGWAKNASTLLQKCRWCGYRKDLTSIRIYLNQECLDALKECEHLNEWTTKYSLGNNYQEIFKEQDYKSILIEKEVKGDNNE